MDEKAEVAAPAQDPKRSKHNSLSKTSTLSQECSDGASQATAHALSGAKDSALLEELKKDEATEKAEEVNEGDDWATDPENARNWSALRKWTSMLVVSVIFPNHISSTHSIIAQVSFYTLIPPLASSMMAPGLPEVAAKYNITNPTVVALTLSIFLISFALAVRNYFHINSPRNNRCCSSSL